MQPPELKAAQVHRPFPPERYLPYLTTNEVAALPKQDAAVIVVVAAIEQHGPHLPVGVDMFINEGYFARAVQRMPGDMPVLILPIQAIGAKTRAGPRTARLALSSEAFVAQPQAHLVSPHHTVSSYPRQ